MTWKPKLTLGLCVSLFSSLIVSVAACDTHAKLARESVSKPDNSSNPMQHQIDGGTYCVQALSQGPPPSAPIHFSNKETETDGSSKDFESDLSGDKLDVTVHERHPATDFDRELNTVRGAQPIPIKDGFAESVRTNHYDRSDTSGWTMGANSVVLGATPWGLFINKPPVTRSGPRRSAASTLSSMPSTRDSKAPWIRPRSSPQAGSRTTTSPAQHGCSKTRIASCN